MIEVKAPNSYAPHHDKYKVFLAGSIEMGQAEDWQKIFTEKLKSYNLVILNPRRDNWDASWEQSIDNPQFREQVEWELQALEDANKIIFYFVPDTKSPVTLMELGLHAGICPQKLIVCCPQGYWRKGNVDILCKRYGVTQTETLDEAARLLESETVVAFPG